jgi:Glycosyl hydrolase catalytic core
VSRPTKRLVTALVVVLLCSSATLVALLRATGDGEVRLADVGPAPGSSGSARTGAQAAAEATAPAPVSSTTRGSRSLAHRVARAAVTVSVRSARSAASGPRSSASASGPARGPAGAGSGSSGRRVSVKKGASVWDQAGITSALADSGVSWMYDWAAAPNGVQAPRGVEFVPMIWGEKSVDATTLGTAKKNGSTLLGFNEPDLAGQSDLTVERALELWPRLQATGMRLGSPAVASGADRDGGWLDRFMAGAKQKGYRVDFITVHWYGSDFDPARATAQLKDYLRATYARYHKPIWVTEYALMNFGDGAKLPSPDVQARFVTSSTAMLKGLSYVERYCWFAFPTSTDGSDGTGLYRPAGAAVERTEPGTAYRAAG